MKRPLPPPIRQRGLSLLELLIATALGLLLGAAALQLLLEVRRSQASLERASLASESARFALHSLAHDARRAGFWAGLLPGHDDALAHRLPAGDPLHLQPPSACLAFAHWSATERDNRLRMPLQSFAAVPAGCESLLRQHKAGSDILLMRYAEAQPSSRIGNARLHLQVAFCHRQAAGSYWLGAEGFEGLQRDCQSPAPLHRYIERLYFIRQDHTLMRAERIGNDSSEWNLQPLVDGIEHLVVELGIDQPSAAGRFIRCPATGCSAPQLLDSVAVRLHVLSRAPQSEPLVAPARRYRMGESWYDVAKASRTRLRELHSLTLQLPHVATRRHRP